MEARCQQLAKQNAEGVSYLFGSIGEEVENR
jgi:hypothetical protein